MTESEIAAACAFLGLARPGTLPNVDETVATADAAPPVDAGALTPDAVRALQTLAAPRATVFAHCQGPTGPVRLRIVVVGDQDAVEQIAEADGAFSLTVLGRDEAVPRVLEFCQLVARPRSAGPPIEVSGRGFLRAKDAAAVDRDEARDQLRGDGVRAVDADALADALARCRTMVNVTVANVPGPGAIAATSLAWFDAGDTGLWQVDAPRLATSGDYGPDGEARLDQVTVRVVPTTSTALADEIMRAVAATS